jgi:membrane protease YdiL (CAAX protease family)
MASDPKPPLPSSEPPDSIPWALPAEPHSLPPTELEAIAAGEPVDVEPVAPPRPHPGFWWSVLWCLAFVIVVNLVFVGAYVVVLLGHLVLSNNPQALMDQLRKGQLDGSPEIRALHSQGNLVGLTAGQLAGLLFALAIVRLVVGPDWKRQLAFRRPSLLHVGLALLTFPGLLALATLAHSVGKAFLPSFDYQGQLEAMFRQWPWGLSIVAIGLGPAVCEELWCRGFLGRGLVGRYGPVAGVLLTAFFFGAMHVDPPHILATVVLGSVLHFTYLMSRSLLLPMLLHFLNNSLAVLALAFGPESTEQAAEAPSGQGPAFLALLDVDGATNRVLFVASALMFMAACWALYRSRVRLVAADDSQAAAWRPPYPGVALPPPDSGTVPVQPWPGWIASGLVLATLAWYVILVLRGSGIPLFPP